ncbi:uncharacterized protein LOC135484508 isoform X1 [Lineus longissimus]|uniref:uncharacterized protein LOC135484508 isoform X1 n=1 Tax=Lineus longissimus TaxID=88925 RepID=UPI002B4E94B2
MYSSLESIEARFRELEKNLCDPGTFICPPRPPVPTWLFEIKSDDIKYEIAAGCSSVAGISTSSIIESSTTSSSNSTVPVNDTSTVTSSISPVNSTVTSSISPGNSTVTSSISPGNSTVTSSISPGNSTALLTTLSSLVTTVVINPSKTDLSGNVTGSPDGGLTTGNATIVASLVIAAVVVIFLVVLVVVGCLRYHKKKKITPMSNGEPGNYLYNNQVKKRRWVGSGNPQILAKLSMNGLTLVHDSPVHSERGEDVENGEETVPSERQQNQMNQSQTFNGIVMPNTDNVTMETEDALLQVKHKKRKKKKKKKRSAITTDSVGDNQNAESVPPQQLPPISTTSKPV